MASIQTTYEFKAEKLKLAIEYAKSKGGACLSKEYINAVDKMEWKCANKEHPSWHTKLNNMIKNGAWCKECSAENSRLKDGLKIAREYAKSKGGECLSTEYLGCKKHLIWKCNNLEHKSWKSCLGDILNNKSWCPYCAQEQHAKDLSNPNGLHLAKKYAKTRNGKCLSSEYKNEITNLLWKCHNQEHIAWLSSYKNVVKKESWCPQCANSVNLSENRTRLILETFFKTKFISCHPEWNKNPFTGYRLQLDGYCEKLQLAFEHDGEHHFREVCFGRKEKDGHFQRQQQRDQAKKDNCIKQGVTLLNIPIPEMKARKNFHAFLDHVIEHCKNYGYDLTFTVKEMKSMEKKFYNI